MDTKDELIEIQYYDKINKKNVYIKVTKEVADYLKSSNQHIRRTQNQYEYFNKGYNEIFNKEHPENFKFLIDEDSDVEKIMEEKSTNKLENIEIENKRTLIQNALCELTDKQREIVEMVIYKNMNYSEIADVLNISKQSVRERMKNAEIKIKKYIKNTQK